MIEYKSGEWRYLGFDLNGNRFTNINFENDADSNRGAWEKSWIDDPWSAPHFLYFKSDYGTDPSYIDWLKRIIE